MAQRKTVYWITEKVNDQHKKQATFLEGKGFQLRFFTSLRDLLAAFSQQRTSIIIVSDTGPINYVTETIKTLNNLPEAQGVRLVLSMESDERKILDLASNCNFWGFIAIDIPWQQWYQQFAFAVGSGQKRHERPANVISSSTISSLEMPARVVWISRTKIRIESRIRPPIGSQINLTGIIADFLGAKYLSLHVRDIQNSHLIYRHSDAIIADWTIPDQNRARVREFFRNLENASSSHRFHIFTAMKSRRLRHKFSEHLVNSPMFRVHAALKKQTLMDEIRYFSPDLFVVDESFCMENKSFLKTEVFPNLNREVQVICFGSSENSKENFDELDRKIYFSSVAHDNMGQYLFNRFLKTSNGIRHPSEADGVFHLPPNNQYSRGNILLPARLTGKHPEFCEIQLPVSVANYAIAKLDSPFLKRAISQPVFIKIMDTEKVDVIEGPFLNKVQGFIMDLSANKKKRLAETIVSELQESFAQYEASTKKSQNLVKEKSDQDSTPKDYDIDIAINRQQDRIESKKARSQETPFSKPFMELIKPFQTKGFKHFVTFISVTTIMVGIIWGIAILIEPYREKSGKRYTESLFNFAPHLREKRLRESREQEDVR